VSGHPRTGGSRWVALGALVALVACGPVEDPDEVPAAAAEAADDVAADAADEGRSRPDEGNRRPDAGTTRPDVGPTRPDAGSTRPDVGAPRPGGESTGSAARPRGRVAGAPFPVPSPSEESLTGEALRARIVAACEAAQPDPPPAGPCVVVRIEERFDPDKLPGWWIGTDPAGGERVPHGATVTVYVADATSGPDGAGSQVEPETSGSADPSNEDGRSETTDPPEGGDLSEQPAPAEEEGSGDGA
jgi:hypothetical protein